MKVDIDKMSTESLREILKSKEEQNTEDVFKEMGGCPGFNFEKSLIVSHQAIIEFIESSSHHNILDCIIYKEKYGNYVIDLCVDEDMDFDESVLKEAEE